MSEFIKQTNLDDLFSINRKTNGDFRGFFREVAHLDEIEDEVGNPIKFVQINHSRSVPGVIRGLHAENWNKLVYPVNGEMISVLVDIRPDSKNFGKFDILSFSDTDRKALFIPKGFANSICVTGDTPVDYVYLVDAYYTGEDTRAIDLNSLGIKWPVKNPIISPRDKNNPTLQQMFPDKFK